MYKYALLFIGITTGNITATTTVTQQSQLLLKLIHTVAHKSTVTDTVLSFIKQQPLLMVITRTHPRHSFQHKDKEKMRQLIGNFANIMQCFFKIVQNPESTENVTLSVAGMLVNIVQAGQVIMKGSDILLDTDKKRLGQWLSSRNEVPKRNSGLIIAKHNFDLA